MEYLIVAAGGIFGSLARYLIGRRIAERVTRAFPIGTFLINISGALLLGIVTSIGLSGNMYTLIGTGFLGAFTTFSTFMYEGFNLFQDNEKLNALVYILASLILGLLAYVVGFEIAKFILII
jgi:CrcB protein